MIDYPPANAEALGNGGLRQTFVEQMLKQHEGISHPYTGGLSRKRERNDVVSRQRCQNEKASKEEGCGSTEWTIARLRVNRPATLLRKASREPSNPDRRGITAQCAILDGVFVQFEPGANTHHSFDRRAPTQISHRC
jgi:hypothetical protein